MSQDYGTPHRNSRGIHFKDLRHDGQREEESVAGLRDRLGIRIARIGEKIKRPHSEKLK